MTTEEMQKEIASLVSRFADYNNENNTYVLRSTKSTKPEVLLKLEQQFCELVNVILLKDGPDRACIDANFKNMRILHHPDKLKPAIRSTEVLWLEEQLSEGANNGVCFTTIGICYDKLVMPNQFKNQDGEGSGASSTDSKNPFNTTHSNNQNTDAPNFPTAGSKKWENQGLTRENLSAWLENRKQHARTYTGRYLFKSLLDLSEQSYDYFDEVGAVKPKGAKAFLKLLPIVFTGYGAALVAEEIFVAYSVYFILLKGGKKLEHQESMELKMLGQTLKELSSVTAAATTTVLVRLTELVVWSTHHSYRAGVKIGSVFQPKLTYSASSSSSSSSSSYSSTSSTQTSGSGKTSASNAYNFWTGSSSSSKKTVPDNPETELCQAITIANKHVDKGLRFNHPELKLIIAPLEEYLRINQRQYLSSLRAGGLKRVKIECFLLRTSVIDASTDSIEEAVQKLRDELEALKQDKGVNSLNSDAALAITCSESVMDLLADPDLTAMIKYTKI